MRPRPRVDNLPSFLTHSQSFITNFCKNRDERNTHTRRNRDGKITQASTVLITSRSDCGGKITQASTVLSTRGEKKSGIYVIVTDSHLSFQTLHVNEPYEASSM